MERRSTFADGNDESLSDGDRSLFEDSGEDVVRIMYPLRRGESLATTRRELTLPRQRGVWLNIEEYIDKAVTQMRVGRMEEQRGTHEFRRTRTALRVGAALNTTLLEPEEDFGVNLLPNRKKITKAGKTGSPSGGGCPDGGGRSPDVPMIPFPSGIMRRVDSVEPVSPTFILPTAGISGEESPLRRVLSQVGSLVDSPTVAGGDSGEAAPISPGWSSHYSSCIPSALLAARANKEEPETPLDRDGNADHPAAAPTRRALVQETLEFLRTSIEYREFVVAGFWWFFLESYTRVLPDQEDKEHVPLAALSTTPNRPTPPGGSDASGRTGTRGDNPLARKVPLHVHKASPLNSWMKATSDRAAEAFRQSSVSPGRKPRAIKPRPPNGAQTARGPGAGTDDLDGSGTTFRISANHSRGLLRNRHSIVGSGTASDNPAPLVIPSPPVRIGADLPDVTRRPTFFVTAASMDEGYGNADGENVDRQNTEGGDSIFWSALAAPSGRSRRASFVEDTQDAFAGGGHDDSMSPAGDGASSPAASRASRSSLRASLRRALPDGGSRARRMSRRESRCSSVLSARSFLASLGAKTAQAEEEDGLAPAEREALHQKRQDELVGKLSKHYARLAVRVQGHVRGQVAGEAIRRRVLLAILPDLTSSCIDSALREALPYAEQQMGSVEASTARIFRRLSYWLVGVDMDGAKLTITGAQAVEKQQQQQQQQQQLQQAQAGGKEVGSPLVAGVGVAERMLAARKATRAGGDGCSTQGESTDGGGGRMARRIPSDAMLAIVKMRSVSPRIRFGDPQRSPRHSDKAQRDQQERETAELLRDLRNELDAICNTEGKRKKASAGTGAEATAQDKYADRGAPKQPLPWYETGRPLAYKRAFIRPQTGFFTLTDNSPMMKRYLDDRRGGTASGARPGEMRWVC